MTSSALVSINGIAVLPASDSSTASPHSFDRSSFSEMGVPIGMRRPTTVRETLCLSLLAMQLPFDLSRAYVGYCDGMDVERIIDEIEQLQEMFEAPDIRPLNATDISAANRRHDETLAHSP